MRKAAIMAAASLLMAVACSVRDGGMQTVVFSVSNVRSGELKGASDVEIESALGMTGPTGTVVLTLESETVSSRRFSVRSGESASVPVGTYRVTGRYSPPAVCRYLDNDFCAEPGYSVDATVVIREGVSEYSVAGTYTCWALVVDYGEVSCVYGKSQSWDPYSAIAVPPVSGDVGVLYVETSSTWDRSSPFYCRVEPVDVSGHEVTDYRLVNRGDASGYVSVSAGRWYCLGPGAVVRQEGVMGVTLGGWQKGM